MWYNWSPRLDVMTMLLRPGSMKNILERANAMEMFLWMLFHLILHKFSHTALFACLSTTEVMAENKKDPEWYLGLMAPNVKGQEFCWLDPTAMYRDADAFHQCVLDLTKPFQPDEVDLVAGIDATGFILGGAIACHLKKGFLAIRKYGHLCVEVDDIRFKDYSKNEKRLEIRKNAFKPGTRVLIVDQWIETGGSMAAAVELVERQQGIVAGIACVCIEEQEGGKRLMEKYKCASSVVSRKLQDQINAQNLESFKTYKPC